MQPSSGLRCVSAWERWEVGALNYQAPERAKKSRVASCWFYDVWTSTQYKYRYADDERYQGITYTLFSVEGTSIVSYDSLTP